MKNLVVVCDCSGVTEMNTISREYSLNILLLNLYEIPSLHHVYENVVNIYIHILSIGKKMYHLKIKGRSQDKYLNR